MILMMASMRKPATPLSSHHLIDLLAEFGVFPVEVGLFFMKDVEIDFVVAAGQLIPAGAAEIAAPVAGQGIALLVVLNIEVLAVFPVGVGAGLLEPLVFVGAVVDHQVHDEVYVPFFGLGQQLVEVGHGPEAGVDVIIVGNVVALVRHGRGIDRTEPDDVHAQLLQIVQLADDAAEVADAVSVGVAEALGINLIGHLAVPPFAFHSSQASQQKSIVLAGKM